MTGKIRKGHKNSFQMARAHPEFPRIGDTAMYLTGVFAMPGRVGGFTTDRIFSYVKRVLFLLDTEIHGVTAIEVEPSRLRNSTWEARAEAMRSVKHLKAAKVKSGPKKQSY